MRRWLYRARQFWGALTARPSRKGMEEAREILPHTLYALFTRLQPSEKAHAIDVMRRVRMHSGDPDLLAAALLHDIGKIVQPLSIWERVLIVLSQEETTRQLVGPVIAPAKPQRTAGLARALAVAEKHPAWGAQLVSDAGASPTLVQLIRRHQDPPADAQQTKVDALLTLLQAADNES